MPHHVCLPRIAGTSICRARLPVLLLSFSFPFISVCIPVARADTAEESNGLVPVIVTATRQPMRTHELMSDASVITRDEIEAAGVSTLTQLLARQPELQMSASGGPGATSSIFIRGAESRHTLVLIDGLRTGSATAGIPNFESIPLAQIERIEIVRGPASALYGSEAIGGVIQIFTRQGEGRPRVDAFAGYGTYNTREADAGFSGASGPFRYSVRAGYSATDGFSATNDPVKQPYSYNPDKDGFWQNSASMGLGWRFDERNDLAFSSLNTSSRSHYDNGNTGYDDHLDRNTGLYGLTLTSRLYDNWKSTFRLGRTVDDVTTYEMTQTTSQRTTQDQLTWQNDVTLPVGQAMVAYEYAKQNIDSTTPYTVTERTVNSFLLGWNGLLGESKAHRLQINGRYDDNSQFGGKATGLVSYGYQFTDTWRGHVAYGTAFNAPTFNQLYWPDTGFGGGNPNLKPEEARNGEIGVNWETAGQTASLVVFDNRIKDMIVGWPPENAAHARLKGASLAWSGRFDSWRLAAGFDWLHARDEDTDLRLPRRADRQGRLSLARQISDWEVGGEVQLVGNRFDDSANTKPLAGYGLVNIFARYALSRDVRLEARIDNLFDKDYETIWGYATPGFNAFLGVRYQPK